MALALSYIGRVALEQNLACHAHRLEVCLAKREHCFVGLGKESMQSTLCLMCSGNIFYISKIAKEIMIFIFHIGWKDISKLASSANICTFQGCESSLLV